MLILLTGASGFLGRRIAHALAAAGHKLICAVRDPEGETARSLPGRKIKADFSADLEPADWLPRLIGVEVVVNAVGILRERRGQTFARLHDAGPRALFAACIAAGVGRVVQISALGADAGARSRYHLSKKAADDFLLTLPLSAVIVQPSLVFGAGGASARLFSGLASLPVIPLPGGGRQAVQPIHVDDAVQAIAALAGNRDCDGQRVPLVGPRALPLRAFLGELRAALGLGPARFLPVPGPLVRSAAVLGNFLPGALLDRETLAMLERGNRAGSEATRRLLGRAPRPPAAFFAAAERPGACALALLAWLLPLLRLSVATLWIVTAIVSLAVFPAAESHALLARAGVPRAWSPPALHAAALLDLAFGVGILVWRRRWLWWGQILLILAYTAIISLRLPEFWLHPFGPILKNLPLLALLGLLLAFERR